MRRLIPRGKELRYWVGLTVIIGIALIIFVISVHKASSETNLSIQIARQPSCLDPARMYSYEEKLIDGALYEGLLKYNPEKRCFEGDLAQKWTADRSGRTYTFVLRKGIRFHDGSRVTARDVKYSWERVLNPKISSYGYLLQNVVGAQEKLSGRCQEVKGIEAVDADTLRVTLKETDWTFPAVVSSPALAVVNQRVAERMGLRYGHPGTRIVGTGPFRLAKWDKGTILMRRNRFFTRLRPSLNTLRFHVISDQRDTRRLFEAGKLDILAGVSGQFTISETKSSRAAYSVFRKPVLGIYFLGFNLRQGPFSDNVELRRGIDQAIDKQRIKEQLLGEGGKTLAGFLPPELLPPGQQAEAKAQFSKEAALKSLDKAGFPYGLRLPPLIYAYNDSPGHEMTARLVQEQLGQVGIDVNLKKIPWHKYQTEIRAGNVHFFRLGWEADYPEAGNLLYNIFSSEQNVSNNYTGYSNSNFDQLLWQARSEPDPARRAEIYGRANQLIASDLPVIPLFQRVATFYLQENLKGFNVDLLGRVDFSRIRKTSRH